MLKLCPRAASTMDVNHPLHPQFSEGKSISYHIRSDSIANMSKTQLKISPTKKL